MVRLKRAPGRLVSAPPRLAAAPKKALPFYQSPEWIALRAEVVAERGSTCEDCGRRGFVIADHIIEIRDGGAKLDKRNLKLRCPSCHGKKTAQAKLARLSGSRNRGGGQKSTTDTPR